MSCDELARVVAEAAAHPREPERQLHPDVPFDVVLHALHVACGAQAIGLTSVRFSILAKPSPPLIPPT